MKITYFKESDGTPFALESEHGFLVLFNKMKSEWVDAPFDFSTLRHDREIREIAREEALALSGGAAPDARLGALVAMVEKNSL